MNRIKSFLNSQHGIGNNFNYDFSLRRLAVAKEDSWRGILPSSYSSDYNPEPPIFSAKFANCDGYRHILAIANEDGKIALQDTTKRNDEAEEKALNGTQCHFNAVFDLEWAPGQMRFVSASGDHTARLWEVTRSDLREIHAFVGHIRSVKTAAFRKCDSSVFATGGRDGAIIIWDTRANLNVDLTPRADNCIYSGHVGGPGTPVSQRKRSRTPKMTPNTTSSSITGLAFQDTNTLISCGAGDGVIKVWDLRRNYSAYKKEPHPKHSLPYAGSSTFRGFTNLVIDKMGSRLFANCMDNTIYSYNLFSYSPQPLARYKGLLNSTFYIKSCLSPDGKYLLSGSSDEKAYIWNLEHPHEPLVSLSGHSVEVTCVAWGATHDRPIVTCSDDARHKIWRVGPEQITESDRNEYYRGQSEFVRQFGNKQAVTGSTHKYNLRDLESTPRSLKRLVEQNERTPGSMEKVPSKRSFLEMLSSVANNDYAPEEQERKRTKTLESRGRRLFSPSTSSGGGTASCSSSSPTQSVRCLPILLSTIPEENTASTSVSGLITSPLSRNQLPSSGNQENNQKSPSFPSTSNKMLNATTSSPLSDRAVMENLNHVYTSPPTTSSSTQINLGALNSISSVSIIGSSQYQSLSDSVIFSPTSNLPNYVVDGEAPHLRIMSPKRKHKEKVDWLTKIRKQKLMSSTRSTTLTEKINEERLNLDSHNSAAAAVGGVCSGVISSPRVQNLRQSEGSPRTAKTPRRRMSSATGAAAQQDYMSPSTLTASPLSQHHPKTPTSSRRNSETTILRFFSVQTQHRTNHDNQQPDTFASAMETELQPLLPATSAPSNTTMIHTPSTTICSEQLTN